MSRSAKVKLQELAFLGVFVAIIVLCFVQIATDLASKGAASGDAFSNSAMFPEIVAALMALLTLVIAIDILRPSPETETQNGDLPAGSVSRLVLGGLVICAYVLTFRWAGFYLSTVVAAALLLALFENRSPIALVLFPLGTALVVGYVFEILFNVVLPLGFFGLTLQTVFG